jgi:fructose/tagatose bisphosphate aldolase
MLRDVPHNARRNQVAIGHFNISDLALKAVSETARELNVPVMVQSIRSEHGQPIFLPFEKNVEETRRTVLATITPHGGSGTNEEVAPHKILPGAIDALATVVRARLQLFDSIESVKGSRT